MIELKGTYWNEVNEPEGIPDHFDAELGEWIYVWNEDRNLYDMQPTSSSFRLGYDNSAAPSGFVDKVYLSDKLIVEEADGVLHSEITSTVSEILLDNLEEGRHYFVRVFRYVDAELVDSSGNETCRTYARNWPFATVPFTEGFTGDDWRDTWYLGTATQQGVSVVNDAGFTSGKAINFSLPSTAPISADFGLGGGQSCLTKAAFELTPPFTLTWKAKALYNPSGNLGIIGLALYNGEGRYCGLYIEGQDLGRSARMYESSMFDIDGGTHSNTQTMPSYGKNENVHAFSYSVDASGITTFLVNGTNLFPGLTFHHRPWHGPVSVWFMGSIIDGAIRYGDIQLSGSGVKPVAGFYGLHNAQTLDVVTAPGSYLFDGHAEHNPASVGALTANINLPGLFVTDNMLSWVGIHESQMANEDIWPRAYQTGNFGCKLGIITRQANQAFHLLKLWGVQRAGYIKARVYDIATSELIPEIELPGNADGFLPDGMRLGALTQEEYDELFETTDRTVPLVIDLSTVTASSIQIELDGYYDGSTLADKDTNYASYYPSALNGVSVSLVNGIAVTLHKLPSGAPAGQSKKASGAVGGVSKRKVNGVWQ